jgi:hypothetical protein
MNKLFTQFYAYRPPEDGQSQNRPTTTDRGHLLDLPGTRVWYPATISRGHDARPDSNRLPDFASRVGWLRYAALAVFVVAGGAAVLATYQRSMNHDA